MSRAFGGAAVASLLLLLLLLLVDSSEAPAAATAPLAVNLSIDWATALAQTHAAATVTVEVMPFMARADWGGPFARYYEALAALGAEFPALRYWMPNPRLTVAELTPSDCTATRPATNWNSTLMDQITADFMTAVCGPGAAAGTCDKSVVTQISTMPSYLYVKGWCPNASASCLPENPYNTTLPNNLYVTGGPGQKFNPELVDATCESMARYVGRVVGWFTAGGFVDECGHNHSSGLHYNWWGMAFLNEGEHHVGMGGASPNERSQAVRYVSCYDAMEKEVRKYNQEIVLVGPESLGGTSPNLTFFMNASNHATKRAPAVASFHDGAIVEAGRGGTAGENSFSQVEGSLRDPSGTTQLAEAMRRATGELELELTADEFIVMVKDWCDTTTVPKNISLPPKAKAGTCDAVGNWGDRPVSAGGDPDLSHAQGVRANRATWSWNVAASVFALLYGSLAELGDYKYIAVDQFVAGPWPDNNPECTCLDWNTGEPNSKYFATQLLAQTVGGKQNKTIVASTISWNGTSWARKGDARQPGSQWVNTTRPLYALPWHEDSDGRKGVLLVNKKSVPMQVTINGFDSSWTALSVEVATEGDGAAEPGYQPQVAKAVSAEGVISLGPFATAVLTQRVHVVGGA